MSSPARGESGRTALQALAARIGGVLILALIAVLFAGLDAAFIFSGPFLPYIDSSFTVFLVAGGAMMAVMGLLSRFGCLYTGFQDEAVVILAGVAAAFAHHAGEVVDADLYATTLAAVIVATVFTALLFLALGTLRLGRIIRYVPFSVTAGFMIAIGGLLMSGGIELAESRGIGAVLGGALHGEMPWKSLMAISVTAAILWAAQRAGGVIALPIVFLLALAAFHSLAALAGIAPARLAEALWLMPTLGSEARPAGWELLATARIDWLQVAGQWRSFLSLGVMSALALLLAVTALELTTRQRVDVDHELRVAGLANLGSALFGGAAGYHDDAVSAMLHKNIAGDKATVLWAALLCALTALIEPGWFAWIPLPLLGGVLIWLGCQMWRDWLFRNGSYLHRSDWIAVLAIVGVTLSIGFIAGVLLGIGVGIALFLVDYSQVRTVRYVANGREIRSNIDRSQTAETILYQQGRRIHVVKLQGYLFFARSHQVLVQLEPVFERLGGEQKCFAVIDFNGVAGVDSTATMAFVRLKQMATDAGVELIFTGLGLEARVDLARVELADEAVRYFNSLDQGLAYCEDQVLSGELGQESTRVGAAEIFGEIVNLSVGRGAADAGGYLREIHLGAGESLMEEGVAADCIYLVVSGSLSVSIAGAAQEQIVLRGLEPGSVFGEMALYLGGTRSAAIVADTQAVLRALDNAALARLEQEDPPTALAVHKLMARLLATKLRQTNTWLSHLR